MSISGQKHSGYRWVIFAVCFFWELILMSLTLPDSLYVVPVTAALGFSRTQFTMVFSIRSVVQLVGNMLYGRLYRRFRVRPLMAAGAVFLVLGYVVYAQAEQLWMFYFAAGVVGIATSLISSSSMTIILNSWFDRSAGMIFGVIFTGSSIGGAVLSSVTGQMIQRLGYSGSYLFTAALAAGSAVPVLVFARERSDYTRPDVPDAPKPDEPFWGLPVVRMALVLCFVIGLTVYPLEASISAHLTDRGFPAEFGANMLGAALLISAIGKVLLGILYDRWGLKTAVVAGAGCFSAGALLFIAVHSRWMAYVFVFVFGLSIAEITTLAPFLAKSILSHDGYSRYIGVFTATLAAGNTIGFSVMSSMFDRTGSYTAIVLIQIVLALTAALFFCRSYDRYRRVSTANKEDNL